MKGSLFVALLFICVSQAHSIALPNDHYWKKYFSAADMARAEKQFSDIRSQLLNSGDSSYDKLTAEYGDILIPVMLRQAGDRNFHFISPDHHFFEFFVTKYPSRGNALSLISQVRDPKAVPLLERLSSDREIGTYARFALYKIRHPDAKGVGFIRQLGPGGSMEIGLYADPPVRVFATSLTAILIGEKHGTVSDLTVGQPVESYSTIDKTGQLVTVTVAPPN